MTVHPVPDGQAVGIDVGADRLHCLALDDALRVHATKVFRASQITELADRLENGATVAIDAPAQLSTAPHREDPSISRKFAPARCAEIALGREYGSWVPYVTPLERPNGDWMATGFALYDELNSRGITTIEVYPYAGYRELARPSRLPKKTTIDGVLARVIALRSAGVDAPQLEMWSHDGLDALLAAVIARDHRNGTALRVSCGHDDSAIWLPAPQSAT